MVREAQGSMYDPAFWGIPSTTPYVPGEYVSRSPAEAHDPDNWRRNWSKRCRVEEEEEEVPSSPVAVEVDADLLGVSTGRMFHRAVNRFVLAQQSKQAMPKPQKSPPVVKKLRKNPDRGAKIQVKPRNRGGYSDRTIISGKAKSAVISELESLPPPEVPASDMKHDNMGRQLHFPMKVLSDTARALTLTRS